MDVVHLSTFLPFLLAILISFLDFAVRSNDRYFEAALEMARGNFRNYAGHDVSEWPFHCFREALVRKGQSAFLLLLIVQCLVSLVVVVAEVPNEGSITAADLHRVLSTAIGMGGLTTVLAFVLVASFLQPYAFAWYYPSTPTSLLHTLRAVAGRLALVFVVWSMLVYPPDLIGLFREFRTLPVDKATIMVAVSIFLTLLPAFIRIRKLSRALSDQHTYVKDLNEALNNALYQADTTVTPAAIMLIKQAKNDDPSLLDIVVKALDLPNQDCIFSKDKDMIAIVLPGVGAPVAGKRADAIVEACRQRLDNSLEAIAVGVSIYKFHGQTAEALLARAQKACAVAERRQSRVAIGLRCDEDRKALWS
jgi:hypothetical protein